MSKELVDRITQYLSAGGLFNPELMEHNKVRDLLIDCRAEFSKPRPDKRELIAKTLYELHSGNCLSTWETHAPWLREMRYREADAIIAALRGGN